METEKFAAVVAAAMSLIKTGYDIVQDMQGRDGLTQEDYLKMIDRLNESQDKARAALVAEIEKKRQEEKEKSGT